MSHGRSFRVTVRVVREHTATVTVWARDQDEADRRALNLWEKQVFTADTWGLGLPQPWDEHEPQLGDPEIDTTFRCVDCDKDTQGGEYYMVRDEVWAASGLGPHDGMLCLRCLEQRIRRPLTNDDFTALVPSQECWQRHLAQRKTPAAKLDESSSSQAVQLSLLEEGTP